MVDFDVVVFFFGFLCGRLLIITRVSGVRIALIRCQVFLISSDADERVSSCHGRKQTDGKQKNGMKRVVMFFRTLEDGKEPPNKGTS